jgi:hypothetical protein
MDKDKMVEALERLPMGEVKIESTFSCSYPKYITTGIHTDDIDIFLEQIALIEKENADLKERLLVVDAGYDAGYRAGCESVKGKAYTRPELLPLDDFPDGF